MIPADVRITQHAFRRFAARWPGGRLPGCPRATLAGLLARSAPEDLGAATVLRMLNNGAQPVRYFEADGWRFVLTEDLSVVLTCERRYLKKPRPVRLGRRRTWSL